MNLSSNTAMIIVLLVTFLWGSWFQAVKHTGDYPIAAFISLMYTCSLPLVWISILLLQRKMIPGGIWSEILAARPLSLLILVCGAVFAAGMQLQLTVVSRIGLILSTSVSATCSILCGTLIASFFGGLPQGASFLSILFASCLLIAATITCQYAGMKRDEEAAAEGDTAAKSRAGDILLLLFINIVLMSAYPLATSLGIRSPLNPAGLSSLTCMGLLVIGAFLGANIMTIIIIKKKQLQQVCLHPKTGRGKILLMALIAACCHFGGNILHAIAAPVISVAIATAMGNSYHVWSYLWGVCYGEFKGASQKIYIILGSGILLFLAGVLILSFNIT